jgi:hypothetical protein
MNTRTYLEIPHEPRLPPTPEASKAQDNARRTHCAMLKERNASSAGVGANRMPFKSWGRAFAGDLQRPSARQGGRIVVANVLASHPANTASRP